VTRLYFLRHGAADRDQWDGSDFERPLTPRGAERTSCVARALARAGAAPDLVLTSPLVRALQTARIAAESLDAPLAVEELLAPGFSADALAVILAGNAGATSLMLVAHEPSFSEVIAEVIGGGRIVMKKSACARVDLSEDGSLRGELAWLLTPGSLGC
jgi:phosphohistidine phosphatase